MYQISLFFTLFLFFSLSFAFSASPSFFSMEVENFSTHDENLAFHDFEDERYEQVRKFVQSNNIGALKPAFNGSVVVAHQGKLIFAESYGVADRAINKENSLYTPTQIASITKTFTGMALLWLQEKGFLEVTDPVQKYLWDFPYSNITIEQLLSHSSGLADYLKFSRKNFTLGNPMYNQDVLNELAQNKYKLTFTPGSRFQYSNTNYAMLGLIIERVSGMTYKEFMKKYVFEPVGMQSTFVYDPLDEPSYSFHAKSYYANFNHFPNTFQDGVYADKGIFTTPSDLLKWDRILNTEEFISKSAIDNAYTPRYSWNMTKNYGLGWRVKTYPNQEKYVYHTGWWHGYQGILSRYIKDDFTIIILSNRFINGISDNAEMLYAGAADVLEMTKLASK